MRAILRSYFVTGMALVLLAATALAQDETPHTVNNQNRSGDLPFSATVGTEAESVDISTGHLSVRVPFASIPGRGMNYRFGIRYESGYWAAALRGVPGNQTYQWKLEKRIYVPDNGMGWQTTQPRVTYVRYNEVCGGPSVTHIDSYIYHDSDGSAHPLELESQTGRCQWNVCGPHCFDQGGFSSSTSTGPDASGAGMWVGNSFRLADGTALGGSGVSITDTLGNFSFAYELLYGGYVDANGNKKSEWPGGLDTLGRAIVTQTNGTNQVLYKVYDSNGVQQTYTVNYASISLSTHFNVTAPPYGSITEYTGTRYKITSIVLPNGRSYSFQYETNGFGGISRIDLPTGAYVTYTWATFSSYQQTYRYVSSRTLVVGGQSYTWSFSRSACVPPNGSCQNVTVTDPLQNQTTYSTIDGTVTSAKFYNGAATGTPVRQYAIDYLMVSGVRSGSGYLPTRITTTLESGQVSKKEYDYDSFSYHFQTCWDSLTCAMNGAPDEEDNTTSRGNVTEIREYDWGQGAPGALLRKTDNTYLHDSNANYLTYNIVNKILTQTVYDGGGAQKAQTQFEYDGTSITGTSGAPQHDYTNYSATFTYRGNASRVKKWRNTDGALLTTTYNYDDLGNIRSITDPGGHTTSWIYDDSFSGSACLPTSNSLAYVSQVTNHLGQRIQVTRYPCTGLVQAHKDENDILASRAGATYAYDLFGRVTQKNLPDGGQTISSYNDSPPVSVTSTTAITGSLSLISTTMMDGLGRATQSQLNSDPEGTVFVDTTYDALGRTSTASNPYRSGADPTYGITSTIYDAIGRVTLVIPPDGGGSANNVSSVYAGNCVTVTDQAGKKRKSCSDALGRLTQVFEPDAGGSFIYETDYQYDTLDNLTRVDQKGNDGNPANWRTRTFAYDSLSQLLTASNPESGTINYTYDADGNLATKIAPLPNQTGSATVTITFGYDALHRLTGKTYSNGDPAVSYFYDQSSYNGLSITNGRGRRTGMSDPSGATAWSYDSEGRALAERRTISGITKSIGYTYNLDGSLASLAYPSGRVVNYAYNGAGRALSVIDTANSINYASAATYAPQGALAGVKYGAVSGGFAGITVSNTFNKRLQPVFISAASPSQTVLSLGYDFHLGTGDNGNLFQIQNNIDSARTQTFTYDELNRVKTAEVPTAWGLNFGYDIWANLLTQTVTKGSAPMLSVAVNTKNQIAGFAYDAAGNLTNDGSQAYVYDGENRLISVAGLTYTYDGDGKRLRKSSGKLYWTGVGSGTLTESDLGGNITDEYIFLGGKRVARRQSTGEVNYYFADHLGTSRVVTNATGTVLDDADFYPFGGERSVLSSSGNNYKFTGKERDSESGLDYFGARHYSSALGRFVSIDPLRASAAPLIPQTWNRYSYALQNPLGFLDPDGKCSAPATPKGQVGICIAIYIQARTFRGGPGNTVIGFGDGRGTTANDKTATSRAEIQLIADPKSKSLTVVNQQASRTWAITLVPPGVLTGQGTVKTDVSQKEKSNGTAQFTVSIEAKNGLSNMPNAPAPANAEVNLSVSDKGASYQGGQSDKFFSLEGFTYQDGKTNQFLDQKETLNTDDLKQMTPLSAPPANPPPPPPPDDKEKKP